MDGTVISWLMSSLSSFRRAYSSSFVIIIPCWVGERKISNKNSTPVSNTWSAFLLLVIILNALKSKGHNSYMALSNDNINMDLEILASTMQIANNTSLVEELWYLHKVRYNFRGRLMKFRTSVINHFFRILNIINCRIDRIAAPNCTLKYGN